MVTPPPMARSIRSSSPPRTWPASDEVWRIGGAQAIAALAYGRRRPHRTGRRRHRPRQRLGRRSQAPGLWRRRASIMVAGPSEIVVVADAKNDPQWTAADHFESQADHGHHDAVDPVHRRRRLCQAVARAVDENWPSSPPPQSRAPHGTPTARSSSSKRSRPPARWSTASPPNTFSSPSINPQGFVRPCSPRRQRLPRSPHTRSDRRLRAGPNHVLPTGPPRPLRQRPCRSSTS